MKPLNGPRVNCLHVIFFQSHWHIVGLSLCKVVEDVFYGSIIPSKLNRAFIVLIPKTSNPTTLKCFSQLVFVRVAYKTITKLIANKLKEILLNIIGSTQTSFIHRRWRIHLMQKKKKVGQIAIKVDLEKAYDFLK